MLALQRFTSCIMCFMIHELDRSPVAGILGPHATVMLLQPLRHIFCITCIEGIISTFHDIYKMLTHNRPPASLPYSFPVNHKYRVEAGRLHRPDC